MPIPIVSFADNRKFKADNDEAVPHEGPPRILHSANVYDLSLLPAPEQDYDPALLFQSNSGANAKTQRSFETIDACLAENRRRSSALIKLAAWRLPESSEHIDDLHEQLDDCRADNWFNSYIGPSRISAISMRELRRRVFGAILKFASENPVVKARWITISHPNWGFGLADRYWDECCFPVPMMFRSLLDIGGIMTAPGYLIGYLHALFDPKHENLRLEYRGICAGEKLDHLHNLPGILADPKNARRIGDYTGLNPKSIAKKIQLGIYQTKNRHLEITGMMPQVATMRAAQSAGLLGRRAPEPYHSLYVKWAHLYRFEPILEMSGVALNCATAATRVDVAVASIDGASLSSVPPD